MGRQYRDRLPVRLALISSKANIKSAGVLRDFVGDWLVSLLFPGRVCMHMQKSIFLGTLLALLAAAPAGAQVTVDVSKITCDQYLQGASGYAL